MSDSPHTVYRFFGPDDEFLYAGCSKEPLTRVRTHSINQPWWREVEYALFEHFDTKAEALSSERNYITRYAPKYNHPYEGRGRRPSDPHRGVAA